MKKSVLIGIIVGTVALVGAVWCVVLGAPQNNCKHDDPTQIVVVEAVAPTCQKTGLTDGKKCNLCGTMVVPQAIVGTIYCIESDWIVDLEATNAVDGKKHTECTMCKALIQQESIPSGNKSLKYSLLDDNTYEVVGIGQCKDKDIVIPSEYNGLSVTSIDERAFYWCKSLTSIKIPNSVKSIGNQAFESCESLTSILIPDSVTSIGDEAFRDCESLTSIIIPKFVRSIGGATFYGCKSLSNIEIHDSVTSIGNYAFMGCTSLTSIEIPDSVTNIGYFAFSGCKSLTSIEIPNSVTSIGEGAFSGCSSLESMVLPFVGGSKFSTIASSSTLFGYIFGTISYTGGSPTKQYLSGRYTTYYIPQTLKTVSITGGNILDGAFCGCSNFTTINLHDRLTTIGIYAFDGCKSLTSIEIPNSVTSIGGGVFYDCTSLTSIVIPDSVTSIGYHVFWECSSLTSINFDGTAEQWNAITKGSYWNYNVPTTEVVCSNGTVSLK